MAAVLKRRKIIDGNASKLDFGSRGGIGAYGHISKAGVTSTGSKTKAASRTKLEGTDKNITVPTVDSGASRKRKLVGDDQEHQNTRKETFSPESARDRTGPAERVVVEPASRVRKKVSFLPQVKQESDKQEQSIVSIPAAQPKNGLKPAFKKSAPVASSRPKAVPTSRIKTAETPTRGARAFLEAFVLASPSHNRSPNQASSPSRKTRDASPSPTSRKPAKPFDEVQDLIELNSALLNTLALHFAHYGTSSPADFRTLFPSIERKWTRRRVTTQDIQRVLGIQYENAEFSTALKYRKLAIVDYGKGRLCIEYDTADAKPLPIESLRAEFTRNIRSLKEENIPFPDAEIIQLASEIEAKPLSKGAKLLEELKSSPTKKTIYVPPSPTKPPPVLKFNDKKNSAKTRGATLLERILAKEAFAASLPAEPSDEELARRAALMRLEEIVPVLEVLAGSSNSARVPYSTTPRSTKNMGDSLAALMSMSSGSGGSLASSTRSVNFEPGPALVKTASFTMSTVVQRLQMSMRNPLAKDEAERCLRVLTEEVAPTWIGIREIGSVVTVSFKGRLGRNEWVARLNELLNGLDG